MRSFHDPWGLLQPASSRSVDQELKTIGHQTVSPGDHPP